MFNFIMRGGALTCLFVSLFVGSVAAQPGVAREAEREYEDRILGIVTDHLGELRETHEAHLEALMQARLELVQEGNVGAVVDLDKRIAAVEKHLTHNKGRSLLLAPWAEIDVEGEAFEIKTVRREAIAYSNRNYVWRGVPASIAGWDYTQFAGGDTPRITVRATTGGVVFLAAEITDHLENEGWILYEDLSFYYTDRDRATLHLLAREMEEGESFEVPHAGWAGTLVLVPTGERRDSIRPLLREYAPVSDD